jgi:2-polyprenyl-6-methoxyphenol hydroxylase-like FAD-dependent oxidoreductase
VVDASRLVLADLASTAMEMDTGSGLEVLIVGAGPTGLTLAAQLAAFGARFRIIDRLRDRSRESRALAVQARTLEVFQTLGLGEALVARGNTSTRLVLHIDQRAAAEVQLSGIGAADTRFPFILFVSQAETEALLSEHLYARGVEVERGVELTAFESGRHGARCVLRHDDGRHETVQTKYLVGCDGAHSSVRRGAGFSFEGGSYPQEFVLGDVDADGPLVAGAINSFAGGRGVAMFFPLGQPRTWRVIAMEPNVGAVSASGAVDEVATGLALPQLQRIVDGPTSGEVRLRDPAWLTRFRLHHRQTGQYRKGAVFLAGDAAHIHSPVGAQGMNTGIQDAWNLGWKLALVARGSADPRLLDSYEAERWPVGRFLLRYTDRIFGTFTSVMAAGRVSTWVRRHIVPRLLPRVFRSGRLRTFAFRFVSELGIHYRKSPAVLEGKPRLKRGPRAGDRLPDVRVAIDERSVFLHEAIAGANLALLLCGDAEDWNPAALAALEARHQDLLRIHLLARRAAPAVLLDATGEAFRRLGVRGSAQFLIRPDGHVAFRCEGRDVDSLQAYLAEWFPSAVEDHGAGRPRQNR